MAYPSWPASVKQTAQQDGYAEAPERNVTSFQPEVGDSIERRRTAIAIDDISFVSWLSSPEWDALIDFYVSTLCGGVLRFTRNHPLTGNLGTFKFSDAPKITQTMGKIYVVSMSMKSL